MAKKARRTASVGKPKSVESGYMLDGTKGRKRVVGGSGILPSARSDVPYQGKNLGAKSDVPYQGKNLGAKSDVPYQGKNLGAKSDTPYKSGLANAKSDAPYAGGIPKSQVDAKQSQIADALLPFKQKSLDSLTQLQSFTEAISNATTMEEINAINEQIRAFQLENSNGE